MNVGFDDDDGGVRLASRFASEVKSRWRQGERADVAAALDDYPELKQHKSIVLDLACNEYLRRVDQGESLDAAEFARRFPTFERSLFLLIEVQRLLGPGADFSSLDANVAWPEPGEAFLGFTLRAELGRGTFARVFLASQPALGNRPVALKVAWQGGKEAEMLGRLRHPNIVPVYSVQEDPETGLTAVCMPYLGRTTLSDVLDRAFADGLVPTQSQIMLEAIAGLHDKSEPAEGVASDRILRSGSYVDGAIHLAAQLADALAYTHARGICHHDLKPSNVLVANDGRPLLLDFNLSFDARTSANRFGGTVPYMAPEQLRLMASESPDDPGRADPRSDLFSLGVILYELLAGVLPFGPLRFSRRLEDTARRLLEQQAAGPGPLREKNPHVDKRLAHLIERCLAFDPDRRPESAATLAAGLRGELAPVRRAQRWVGSHRKPVAAAVVAWLALVLGSVAYLASRPSYYDRQLQHGTELFDQGRYELAIASFDNAIRATPKEAYDAKFARGRAYQKLDEPRLAYEDFRIVYDKTMRPEAAAGMAYSMAKLRQATIAVSFGEAAVKAGFASAGVLNNLGNAYLKLARNDDAERVLKQALQQDANLQAVHYNLAAVYLNRAFAGKPLAPAARTHVQKALELGPPCAQLYALASHVCLLSAGLDAGTVRQALEYLEKAHALGFDVRAVESVPIYRSLKDLDQFKRLQAAPADTKAVAQDFLVDPL